MKAKFRLASVSTLEENPLKRDSRYRCRSIPSSGQLLRQDDEAQILIEEFSPED